MKLPWVLHKADPGTVTIPTVLIMPTEQTSPEVQTNSIPKPDSGDRSSPEVDSKSSEAQTDSIPKPNSEDRSSPEVDSRSSEAQTDSIPKPNSGYRSSPEAHSKSSEAQTDSIPKPNSEDRSSPEVDSRSSEAQTDSIPKPNSGDRSSSESQRTALPTSTAQSTMQPEQRRSLLIYGADRSGTTFTTKMFAEDPQLMTVYEPLWITSRWNEEDSAQVKNWSRNVLDLLRGILSCKFAESDAGIRFLSFSSQQWSGAFVKNPFKSPAFCPNDTCTDLNFIPHYADTVCLTKYKHSVTKIGEPRTPGNLISSFLPMLFSENPEADVRVIQLIRDPRASLNSRIKLGWMANHQHRNFPNIVGRVCSNLAENIRFGRNLGKWQEKYLEVHYRDLAGKPLETTKAMYKFAGFEMPDSVVDWVVRNTSPSKEELIKQQDKTFSSVRNSTANVDKWQQESPVERTRIIEEQCKDGLDLLGLTNIL